MLVDVDGLGYLVGTAIFGLIFLFAVAMIGGGDLSVLYWTTIVASTTVRHDPGCFADRSLGVGYAGGASVLFVLLTLSLAIWYWSLGSISIKSVSSPKSEVFYWITIMFSQTLGTALGDWTADTAGLGYVGGALVFAALLGSVLAAFSWTSISTTLLFWAAFILTRPLGAVVGDFLDKPISAGGLALIDTQHRLRCSPSSWSASSLFLSGQPRLTEQAIDQERKERKHPPPFLPQSAPGRTRAAWRFHRSSPSSPAEAGTGGLTRAITPDRTHAFWLGANRGASKPSLISRVTAKRVNCVAGMNNRELSENPSDPVSTSPSAAETTPSWLVSILATSTA